MGQGHYKDSGTLLMDYEIECGVSHVDRVMMQCYWDSGEEASEANSTVAPRHPSPDVLVEIGATMPHPVWYRMLRQAQMG